uniref:3-oxoacyl-[acyl-carrier-protein] reductase FabG-like n=1 Tax=Styela clava TaxID=7725 RepID=UPI001939E40E|nr:3-oxoacyl-[acyl-carrier-protein] reductase FabG-like [Styela clava]
MSDSFQNKVVLVTGASSGFGKAIALQFAERGALLALTGRNKVNLEKVATECKNKGAKDVLMTLADLGKLEEIKNVAEKTIEKYGKLDVLVNNAGVIQFGNLENSKLEDLDWQLNINVKAVVYLTQLLIPHLVISKGNIVNISSVSSTMQFPQALFYGLTKSALDQFTKTIALEYAPKGVQVNSVNPSIVPTALLRTVPGGIPDDATFEKISSLHPIGRNGTVDEVASAVLFLASDSSAWTTGQCLMLDGARSLNVK